VASTAPPGFAGESGESANPDALFAEAIRQAHATTLPPFLSYEYSVTLEHHSKTKSYRYDVLERTSDHYARFTGLDPDGSLSDDVHLHSVLVSPALFLSAVRAEDDSAAPESIATVYASPYDISLAGTEPAGSCAAAFKLELRPKTEPETHALRELWVDTASGRICRATLFKMVWIIAREPVLIDMEIGPDGYVSRWHLAGTGRFIVGSYSLRADGAFSELSVVPAADPKLFR
jgi:hypothetical protein